MRDLIFVFVDHFEPHWPGDVDAWVRRWPETALRFADAGGNAPKHTWFYDDCDPQVLDALGGLCRQGLGEIEVHLHHSFDTSFGLRDKLERRKRVYADHGALVTVGDPTLHTFGFIHGKWSLDNSRGDECCGVTDELQVLRECGCYADFTFPAWGPMQPRLANAIYYATDDPAASKSYTRGVPVAVGRAPSGDLMIFEGPGRLSGVPVSLARFRPLVRLADVLFTTCDISAHLPPTRERIARWVRADVHVEGRPEWVFVKVHTHGARPANCEACFGAPAQAMYEELARRYNDGASWRLHYATAREAYNMVKAAEAGRSGDPEAYRDFLIPPYRNTR